MTDTKQEAPKQEVAKAEPTMSQRFMNKVIAEFSGGVGELALTDFQKRLAQNYFIAIDATLKSAEEKRLKKTEKYRDAVPVTWAHINMELLARSVVAAARTGLDPVQKNHVSMIPYKNNAMGVYDIGFIDGYRGMELKSAKYGLNIPDSIIIELVYTKDMFKSFKKDRNNSFETFNFEIVDDFDRGEIRGGFYYYVYNDHPEKNLLVVLTLHDIEKRKPKYASPEFWGGEKDIWENNKKVGKETIEGWYKEMCWKTIARAAYGNITIDSQKIDDDYIRLKQLEQDAKDAQFEEEVSEQANKTVIDITDTVEDLGPAEEKKNPEQPPVTDITPPAQEELKATGTDGPGY